MKRMTYILITQVKSNKILIIKYSSLIKGKQKNQKIEKTGKKIIKKTKL